jgi:hypothetical protein
MTMRPAGLPPMSMSKKTYARLCVCVCVCVRWEREVEVVVFFLLVSLRSRSEAIDPDAPIDIFIFLERDSKSCTGSNSHMKFQNEKKSVLCMSPWKRKGKRSSPRRPLLREGERRRMAIQIET